MFTKDEILNEIKRTTKENHGKPLGEATFKNETAIGSFEWGRYWPRFGDALQEAGFERNKLRERVSDEVLVKEMISKIRKFGKYPVLNELRIEGDKDSNFPYTVIKKRGQEFIVKKIIEYCSGNTDYDDILKACEPIIVKLNKREKSDSIDMPGIVGEIYLFKSGRHYKIGKTNDTVRRGSEIRIQLPEKMELIHSIKTDDLSGVELYWHNRFKEKRMKGEWFRLNSQDVRAFKLWKKIY